MGFRVENGGLVRNHAKKACAGVGRATMLNGWQRWNLALGVTESVLRSGPITQRELEYLYQTHG